MPENAQELAKAYLLSLSKKLEDLPLSNSVIGNMDETPLWFDTHSATTIDFVGVKTVPCKTTGHEKLRFTAVPTILSNGSHLPTLIIFRKLKSVPPGPFPRDVIVCVNDSGVMTSDIMVHEYIPKVITVYILVVVKVKVCMHMVLDWIGLDCIVLYCIVLY